MRYGITALERVSAPAVDVVSLADFKAHARIDGSADDATAGAMVAAAIARVDGEGVLGRALVTQTWAQWSPGDVSHLPLEMGPFQSLTSVEYYDFDGFLQTATLADFRVERRGWHRVLTPVPGKSWPAMQTRDDALKVTYVAGFGDASADVPQDIRQAILMLAAHFYEHREAVADAKMSAVPIGVDDLLGAHRVGWYGG